MIKLKTSTEKNQSESRCGKCDIVHPEQHIHDSSASDNIVWESHQTTQNSITNDTSAVLNLSAMNSLLESETPVPNIKFIPVKIKDFLKMLQNNPAYNNQFQAVSKNEITTQSISSEQPLSKLPVILPISTKRKLENIFSSQSQMKDAPLQQTSNGNKVKNSPIRLDNRDPRYNENERLFAIPDVEAFPLIGISGYRAYTDARTKKRERSRTKRKHEKRNHSRTPRRKTRSPSRTGYRPSKSGRKYPKRAKGPKVSTKPLRERTPIVITKSSKERPPITITKSSRDRSPICVTRKRVCPIRNQYELPCCRPYPLCDNDHGYSLPKPTYVVYNRPLHKVSRYTMKTPGYTNRCVHEEETFSERNQCMLMLNEDDNGGLMHVCPCDSREKLQFIQPGLCSKKENLWTNEYAIIPKAKINLIDPCRDLDDIIHPIANRPCIRDKRGSPLTDCIGRPLRDPTGKKFLKFSANGSILDTNLKGNFYSGQPPLCVKQPLPKCSCAQDTTHRWWMTDGQPALPDMGAYFKHVVKNENERWC